MRDEFSVFGLAPRKTLAYVHFEYSMFERIQGMESHSQLFDRQDTDRNLWDYQAMED
jgi:hypothetical protein